MRHYLVSRRHPSVEVAPAYDVGEITALNAASFMAFYMGLLAGAKDRSS